MSYSLREYSELVKKSIALVQHDVEPQFLPNLRHIRDGSMFCLDILHSKISAVNSMGLTKQHNGLSDVFKEALQYAVTNIRKHRRWSFWHYALVCSVTSLAYSAMLAKGEHKSIHLDKQSTWDDPDEKVAILFFNFVSGQLYPTALPEIIKLNNLDEIFTRNEATVQRYDFFLRFIIRQIKLVTGEISE